MFDASIIGHMTHVELIIEFLSTRPNIALTTVATASVIRVLSLSMPHFTSYRFSVPHMPVLCLLTLPFKRKVVSSLKQAGRQIRYIHKQDGFDDRHAKRLFWLSEGHY